MSVIRRPSTVGPPSLDRAIGSLTDGLQKAVTSLYQLQSALINCLPPSHGSDTILDQFKRTRRGLRAEWISYKDLLRRCCIYSDLYVTFVVTESPEVYKRLQPQAKEVRGKAAVAKVRYDNLYEELQKYRYKLLPMLRSSVRGVESAPYVQDAHKIAQAALTWAQPDGPESLEKSYSALDQIGTSLRDIVVFWTYHVDEIDTILKSHCAPTDEASSSTATWRRTKATIEEAMRFVSESVETIQINAVGAPSIRRPPLIHRIFRKLIRMFGGG